jgi:sulfatase maturation enzyme AslB (radical SAM superfamily)
MSWGTARTALELLLASAAEERTVEFSGGEPTLEPLLLRRCLEYLRSAGPPGTAVDCTLTTNGTLLDDDLLSLLVRHDVSIDLSFDGLPAAQDLRSMDSFATLDRLLVRIRRQHPRYFAHRVAVRMVVQPVTLPCLAESVRYLFAREVPSIAVGPGIMRDFVSEWGSEELLRQQVGQIVADSLRQLGLTGTIPVGFLAGGNREPGLRASPPRCAAVSGACICVDAAGSVWGCPLFARSLRRLPPLAANTTRLVALGTIRDRALGARHARHPEESLRWPLFSSSSTRHCGTRRCRDCEFAADCFICPAAICEHKDCTDPHNVPGFHCAFSKITLEGRRRFRERLEGTSSGKCPPELAQRLRRVTMALRADTSSVSTERLQRP